MTAHQINTIAVQLFVCAGPQPGCQPLSSSWLLATRKSSTALSFNPLQQAFGTHASIQKRVVKSDFRFYATVRCRLCHYTKLPWRETKTKNGLQAFTKAKQRKEASAKSVRPARPLQLFS
jgi:hypothetical protein